MTPSDGSVVGQDFGLDAGDEVRYKVELKQPIQDAILVWRFQIPKDQHVVFSMTGAASGEVAFQGDGSFRTVATHLGPMTAGTHDLRFTSKGGAGIVLNGFAVVELRYGEPPTVQAEGVAPGSGGQQGRESRHDAEVQRSRQLLRHIFGRLLCRSAGNQVAQSRPGLRQHGRPANVSTHLRQRQRTRRRRSGRTFSAYMVEADHPARELDARDLRLCVDWFGRVGASSSGASLIRTLQRTNVRSARRATKRFGLRPYPKERRFARASNCWRQSP